jgi:CRISPR-associated protein Cas1
MGSDEVTLVYLNQQGTLVRRSKKSLLITRCGEILGEVGVNGLTGIMVYGNVQLTTQALGLLLDSGIDVGFFSLTGRIKGKLSSTDSNNVFLRLAQHRYWTEPESKLGFSKALIKAKINNQRSLLQRHYWNHSDLSGLALPIARLKGFIKNVAGCGDENSLRGLEGAAANQYFTGLKEALRVDLGFQGRKRRPPTDPINSLFSFGYSLLTSEICKLLDSSGFDPYIGFFHGVRYGRVSLALDLIEPFRALIIDSLVISLVNLKILREEHFEKRKDGGVYLNEEGRRSFFKHYDSVMSSELEAQEGLKKTSGRSLLINEVMNLRQAFLCNSEFIPYQWKE